VSGITEELTVADTLYRIRGRQNVKPVP
jgi:hypothetical protein